MRGDDLQKRAATAIVWLLLLGMPFWLPAIGGYTELGARVVVLGLAAMSLNFLLGYTGVLSFGHAAYFGLGAYGAGMTIRYLVPSTSLSIIIGTLVGTIAAALIGPMIIRLRGVYFAMVTIAFGQTFYFIAFRWNTVTGGDDGLIGWTRQPLDFGFAKIDILHNSVSFYYLVLVLFAIATGCWYLDLHPNKITTGSANAVPRQQPKPYDIPYRTLLPKGVANLLVGPLGLNWLAAAIAVAAWLETLALIVLLRAREPDLGAGLRHLGIVMVKSLLVALDYLSLLAELKPGTQIAIVRAVKKPDGSLEANRVNVGRGGVVPQ